jgi:hypothetical protein
MFSAKISRFSVLFAEKFETDFGDNLKGKIFASTLAVPRLRGAGVTPTQKRPRQRQNDRRRLLQPRTHHDPATHLRGGVDQAQLVRPAGGQQELLVPPVGQQGHRRGQGSLLHHHTAAQGEALRQGAGGQIQLAETPVLA